MKAAKASPGKSKKKEADLKIVTFRLSVSNKQFLVDYGLALANIMRRRVSNNEAVRHMITHATLPKAKLKRAPKTNGAAATA